MAGRLRELAFVTLLSLEIFKLIRSYFITLYHTEGETNTFIVIKLSFQLLRKTSEHKTSARQWAAKDQETPTRAFV